MSTSSPTRTGFRSWVTAVAAAIALTATLLLVPTQPASVASPTEPSPAAGPTPHRPGGGVRMLSR